MWSAISGGSGKPTTLPFGSSLSSTKKNPTQKQHQALGGDPLHRQQVQHQHHHHLFPSPPTSAAAWGLFLKQRWVQVQAAGILVLWFIVYNTGMISMPHVNVQHRQQNSNQQQQNHPQQAGALSLGSSLGDLLQVERPSKVVAASPEIFGGAAAVMKAPSEEEEQKRLAAAAAAAEAEKKAEAVLSHPAADKYAIRQFRSQSSDNKFAVFYNFFMSPMGGSVKDGNETFQQVALRIAREQMDQIGRSAVHKKGSEKFTIYYNTIGRKDGLNASYAHEICRKRNSLHCVHMRHYDKGFEQVTVQRLYEYCHVHPTHRVVYMHSKGTFHLSQNNEALRRYLTEAVMREECLHPPGGDDSCNVCGLLFQPVWLPMFPGNFWTAQCSYINQLLPPAEYSKARASALQGAVPQNTLGFTFNMYTHLDTWTVGLDRYAMEAWVASHPTVKPCHFSKEPRVRYWYKEKRNINKEYQWHLATSRNGLHNTTYFLMKKYNFEKIVMPNATVRFREYFLLPGMLYKWMRLYDNQVPPPDSWVWKFFPDSEVWQSAIEKYGNRTVEVMVTAARQNKLKTVL